MSLSKPGKQSEQSISISLQIADPAIRHELVEALGNCDQLELTKADEAEWLLEYDLHSVQLRHHTDKPGNGIEPEILSARGAHRLKHGGGRGQQIAKAVGFKPGITPSILDATAGLGRDSLVFASLGAQVIMLERSPVLAALQRIGLLVASLKDELQPLADRMQLIEGDALNYLRSKGEPVADVIYLDPMFPQREKSALVKKEMRLFKSLVGTDEDADQLLAAARAKARYRVVVKRPRKAPALAGQPPSYSLEGKSCRFDIYALASINGLKR